MFLLFLTSHLKLKKEIEDKSAKRIFEEKTKLRSINFSTNTLNHTICVILVKITNKSNINFMQYSFLETTKQFQCVDTEPKNHTNDTRKEDEVKKK